MASSLIHICVAKKINDRLNLDPKQLYLGTIAPDLSKLVGETKLKSHFLDNNSNIPNIQTFLKKYKTKLNEPFVLGYFIHLLTDQIWFKDFISKKKYANSIKLIDGTVINVSEQEATQLIYNDYTNLNIKLIDYYSLDLSLFYEPLIKPSNIIKEIPLDKLNVLVNKAGEILMNTKTKKNYIFDINDIILFVDECTNKFFDIIKNT